MTCPPTSYRKPSFVISVLARPPASGLASSRAQLPRFCKWCKRWDSQTCSRWWLWELTSCCSLLAAPSPVGPVEIEKLNEKSSTCQCRHLPSHTCSDDKSVYWCGAIGMRSVASIDTIDAITSINSVDCDHARYSWWWRWCRMSVEMQTERDERGSWLFFIGIELVRVPKSVLKRAFWPGSFFSKAVKSLKNGNLKIRKLGAYLIFSYT